MAHLNTKMRELRTPLTGTFAYASGCGEAGRAEWLNISRTGAAIQLGRYLRPGHPIQLLLESGTGEEWNFPARIAWCVSVPGTLQFQAGLAVQRTSPESALQFATLGYEALALNKNNSNSVVTAVWPGFTPAELPTRPNILVRAV